MTEWFFDNGGLPLCICEWGTPQPGRPVTVVLHGFLEQGAAWDAVARRLPGRVVAPDHRGHGRSAHLGPGGFYHFFDYVADLDALVSHLGAPIDLVGHSMGGTIACYFAGTRPEAVRRLVLVEGLGPPDAGGEIRTRALRHLDDRRAGKRHAPLPDLDAATDRVRRWNPNLDPAVARSLVARITRPAIEGDPEISPGPVPPGALRWTWDPRHRMRNATPFDAERFRAFLSAIRAPTLLVRGGRSGFVFPDLDARAACLADARHHILPEAGHLVHHEAPGELADLIAGHLGVMGT